ncbi:MAG: efflux RND transporter permease subunit [Pseudomonadota bacterium]
MISWFARNPVAANLLMFGIIIAGITSAMRSIPMEVFPSFTLDRVSIQTQFRGATPRSVQDGLTTRIEEAIYDIEGIDEVNARSSEGLSQVFADIASGYDRREVLDKIKLRVDSLNTIPLAAEKPVVSLSARNWGVVFIAVSGDPEKGFDERSLRAYADKVREDLLATKEISLVEFDGVRNYEIGIEISPATLQSYNLTLEDIGRAIRESSADISAGNIQSRNGDILVRADGQAYTSDDFKRIPVIYDEAGIPIRLGQIANVVDGFEDQPLISVFNGKPAVMLEVLRVGDQSAIAVSNTALDYIAETNKIAPAGIELAYWDDDAAIIRARLQTLMWSGIQGGFLVLLLLSLFLRPAVAFWVFLGIPVSFMGALIFMPFVNGTFNIMSLFAFITVLGIVVDDAIVTGENIYRKMREGHDSLTASIIGTKQIAVPVTFGILTTVVAFLPLADLGNNRLGILAGQIPMVVIPVLLMSLVESKFVLPAHLSHVQPRGETASANIFSRVQMRISRGLETFIEQKYQPVLHWSLNNRLITATLIFGISAVILAFALYGHIKYTHWPRVQSEEIRFSLTMPDTTGFETTHGHIERISQVVRDFQDKYTNPETGESIIRHIFSTSGSSGGSNKASVGRVAVEIIPPPERHVQITATELAREIRQAVGDIPGAQKFSIRAEAGGGVNPIAVELSGKDFARIDEMVDRIRTKLAEYPTVFDIQDNYTGGKEEINIQLKPRAHSLGLTLSDVASQVRDAVFGFQAQRIQRGRDELRVMLRYPLSDRSTVNDLYSLPIRVAGSSTLIPLSDLVDFEASSSPTTLYRLDRDAVVTITADLDKKLTDVGALMRDLDVFMRDLKQSFPEVTYSYKGEAEERAESNALLATGSVLVIIAIYALLAIPFKSYWQPLIVMSVIPFSIVGGVFGHMILLKDMSFLSVVGILALTGVVVNDSLVLVDYINQKRREGLEVFEAVLKSGAARFRPVMLTSLTTFAGLTPLLLDNSTQAEFLKPMAISLGFGILFTTFITLILVPITYISAENGKNSLVRLLQAWLRFWNDEQGQSLTKSRS